MASRKCRELGSRVNASVSPRCASWRGCGVSWLVGVLALTALGGSPPEQAESNADTEDRDKPTLGLKALPIDDEVKDVLRRGDLPKLTTGGVYILEVLPGSPAAQGGIRPGDVLVGEVNAKVLTTLARYHEWLASLEVGQDVRLKLRRVVPDRRDRPVWKKLKVTVIPSTRARVEERALRYGYLRVDGQWVKLPHFDFTQLTSAMGTREQVSESIPRVAVGEHGKLSGLRVVQILGPTDMIVATWSDTWIRLTGVNTTGLTDGCGVELDGPVGIIGTWRYTTVLGSGRTILLAAPVRLLQQGLSSAELEQLKAWLD